MSNPLLVPEIQAFIERHLNDDLAKLILKGSPFPEVSIQEIAQQIAGKRKAEKKLPTWFNTENILYPKQLNLSQSSSETTARYKSELVSGALLIDLTGGFGIDSFFFAKTIEKVIHCERDPELSNLAKQNFQHLSDRKNVEFIAGDGVETMRTSQQVFDWIYLDPSRRTDSGNRVFRLEDCQPDVIALLPLLLEKGKKILLKTSPLLDLNLGISTLKMVEKIHIVAVSNDVKELLWVLSPNAPTEKTELTTVDFKREEKKMFHGFFEEEQWHAPNISEPLHYLYEPNAAVMKSGLFNTLSVKTGVSKLHSNSHLYTSEVLIDFPGRAFKILETLPFKPKLLSHKIPSKKANIAIRNFPKTVAQLRKQLKFEDGGKVYLFFTTNQHEQKIVLVCEKISTTEIVPN